MHLYSSDELRLLFTEAGCEVVEVAGSNVTAFEGTIKEGSPALEQIAAEPQAWATTVELERALHRVPGLIDSGSHIILAARRSA